MEIKQQVATVLRQLREQQGLTQQDVAGKVGVTWKQYQRWESGEHVRLEHLPLLADIFGVTPAELVGGAPTVTGRNGVDLTNEVAMLRARTSEMQKQMRDLAREIKLVRQQQAGQPDEQLVLRRRLYEIICVKHGISLTEVARRRGRMVSTTGDPDPTAAGREVGWYSNPRGTKTIPRAEAKAILRDCGIDPRELDDL
jgi:transcriptional regulator with XRE-family HTH domain